MVNTLIFATLKRTLVRCLSGRKERFAKPSYGLNCTEGSNPSLTASPDRFFFSSGRSVARLSCPDVDREGRSQIRSR